MSKAILVLDMPESCICCPCRYQYSDGGELCRAECKQLQMPYDLMRKRPDWCPLQECLVGEYEGKIIKEIPKRKGLQGLTQFDTDNHYEMGWNACLDEILGE